MKFRPVLRQASIILGISMAAGTILLPALPVQAAPATPSPVVLDAGYLQFAPLVKAFDGNPGRVESFTPGIAVNKKSWLEDAETKNFSAETFLPANQAIIHLGEPDRNAAGGYGTPATENFLAGGALKGSKQSGADYIAAGRLLLGSGTLMSKGADKSSSELNARGETTRDFTGSNSANAMKLTAVSGPSGATAVVTGSAGGTENSWDSGKLSSGAAQPALEMNITGSLATHFSAAGRYCLTIEQTIKSKQSGLLSASATYTVYAGKLPAQPTLCEGSQPDPDPGTPDPNNPDPGTPSAPVKVLGSGHLDIRAPLSGNGKSLQLQAANSQQRVPFKDLVLTGVRSGKVPLTNSQQNFSVVGSPGTPYWYYGQGEEDLEHHVWPGFSGEDFAPADLAFGFEDASLTKVLGPVGGHFAMFFNDAVTDRLRPDAVYFDTRQGMPQSYPIGAASHNHFNWTFTQPGKYCLAFEAKALRSSGAWASDIAQLTVWVGDPALAASQIPCDRSGGTSGLSVLSRPKTAPAPQRISPVQQAGMITLEPALEAGQLGLNARVQGNTAQASRDVLPGNLILSSSLLSGGKYLFDSGDGESSPALLFDSARITPSSLSGLLEISFGKVAGPGNVELLRGNTAILSSDARRGLPQTLLAAQSRDNSVRWAFDQPGVYCVPVNLSAQLPGSTQPLRSSSVLSFVVGSTDPSASDYVNRSQLKACAQGGRPSKPGDAVKPGGWGTEPGAQKPVGVTVISEGHVDIASRAAGNGMTTQIKDSSQGSVVYRNPAKTVFQVKNQAKRTIQAGSSFGFLGKSGSQVYLLGQTQESGLLWPGWSTEEVPELGPVTWTLTKLGTLGSGPAPGNFAMYQLGDLGQPEIKFNSAAGVNQFTIPAAVHQHGSWVFSAPGVYCTAFHRGAANGASSDFTVAWAVGEQLDASMVDPARCFAGEKVQGLPDTVKSAGEAPDIAAAANAGAAQSSAPVMCLAGTTSTTLPTGATILDQGHVDFATRVVDGRLRSQIKDGTTGTVQWREPASTVIKLKPAAKITSPGGAFDFLGPAGSSIYQIPQTQRPGLVWLGWNTEELGSGQVSGPVTWSLDAVEGPGQVHIFELSAFGSPIQVLSAGSSYQIPLNTHAHGNWAFSEPGLYRLKMTQEAVLSGGPRVSDSQVLTVLVGDAPAAIAAKPVNSASGSTAVKAPKSGQANCVASAVQKKTTLKPASKAPSGLTQASVPLEADGNTTAQAAWPLWWWIALGAGVLLLGAGFGTGGTIWVLRKK
ncbi:TIGR03773 family transporter-associated surface protein [Psychromicrobium lacuslunae]|uniref:ABC transporter-associated repeat protein n=1 Tax=Psychromicrobium lacuslunae TaxID=1618207 RepID=A0A0D4C0G2_9MICC|nr:TIGR03773 family transporter-associated surface protein [Psychromicrobium lacuslunae]AJT42162.1 hypothetical protein UM93_12790 [Psychromicrobium lacuslunae]